MKKRSIKTLLLISILCLSIPAAAQTTASQSITTAWGNYVDADLYGHGNVLLQVNVEGQNCIWNGIFSLNGTNSYTPDITWNNVKLISWSGYNTSVDEVQALIMSNTAPNAYGGTTIVFKLGQPANGSAVIRVVATAATTYTFSLVLVDKSTAPPYSYTMASSAGTYNMWTVNNNVGIGTSAPKTRLDLGELRLGLITSFPSEGSILEGDWGNYIIGNINTPGINQRLRLGVANDLYTRAEIFLDNSNRPDGTIAFKTANTNGGAQTRMFIRGDGFVGIGTENPQSELAVNGTITSKKVKVTLNGWSDYVFYPTYRLRPLSEVEQYIKQHHHLPEVPNEADVKKDGLDVGENQATLLKKIEELTLYLIEQNKRIEKLESANEQLRLENQKKGIH